VLPEVHVPEITIPFPAGSELILFTDGLYELLDPKGGHGSYDEFSAYLQAGIKRGRPPWEAILEWAASARENNIVDDDVSLMRFTVPA